MARQEVGIDGRPDQRGGDGQDPQRGMAPFFIVGAPRSGTTLLRIMLDRHPDLAIPPESHFIPRLWARRRRYGKDGIVEERELFLHDLASDPRFREWGIPIEAVREELSSSSAPPLADAIDAAFFAYAKHMGKSRWGDKTPGYSRHITLLALLFAEARFIHLLRDGRDVVLSQQAVRHQHPGPAPAAYVWGRRVRATRRVGEALGSHRYAELRYEDLLDDQVGELQRMCDFLGLPFDRVILEHDGQGLEKIPAPRRRRHTRIALPPTKGLRDWRTEMPERQIAEFEAVAHRGLAAAGYELHLERVPLAARLRAWNQVAWFGVRILRSQTRELGRKMVRQTRALGGKMRP